MTLDPLSLIPWALCPINMARGFTLIEVLLSLSIITLFVTFGIGALVYTAQSSVAVGSQLQALYLAEEGLEAVRNIRDENMNDVPIGTFGLSASGGQWALTDSSDTTAQFVRTINISALDNDTKRVTVSVTWPQTSYRTGTVTLITNLTDWRRARGRQ